MNSRALANLRRPAVAAALPLLGIPGTTQSAIYGAVILVALLIDRLARQQGQNRYLVSGGA